MSGRLTIDPRPDEGRHYDFSERPGGGQPQLSSREQPQVVCRQQHDKAGCQKDHNRRDDRCPRPGAEARTESDINEHGQQTEEKPQARCFAKMAEADCGTIFDLNASTYSRPSTKWAIMKPLTLMISPATSPPRTSRTQLIVDMIDLQTLTAACRRRGARGKHRRPRIDRTGVPVGGTQAYARYRVRCAIRGRASCAASRDT